MMCNAPCTAIAFEKLDCGGYLNGRTGGQWQGREDGCERVNALAANKRLGGGGTCGQASLHGTDLGGGAPWLVPREHRACGPAVAVSDVYVYVAVALAAPGPLAPGPPRRPVEVHRSVPDHSAAMRAPGRGEVIDGKWARPICTI